MVFFICLTVSNSKKGYIYMRINCLYRNEVLCLIYNIVYILQHCFGFEIMRLMLSIQNISKEKDVPLFPVALKLYNGICIKLSYLIYCKLYLCIKFLIFMY